MGFFFFGTVRKARQFEYKPLHWDPEAEEREARRQRILGPDHAKGQYVPGMYIREKRMQRMQEEGSRHTERTRRTMIRSSIFVVLALALVYIMFTYFAKIVV